MYVFLIFLIIAGPYIAYRKNLFDYTIDKDKSYAVRGVLAILIILHHCSFYFDSDIWDSFFSQIGAPICGVFFILSGYGLYLQKDKIKGMSIGEYFNKRVSGVLYDYITVIILYQLFKIATGHFSFNITVNRLLAGEIDTLLPYSWFIVVLLFLYILFYAVVSTTRNILVYVSGGVILMYVFFLFVNLGTWWYCSILAFPTGMFVAANTHSSKPSYFYVLLLIISIASLSVYSFDEHYVMKSLVCPILSLGILYTMVNLPDTIYNYLRKLSAYSFLIYMFQGMAFSISHKISSNIFVFAFSTICISILLSIGFMWLKSVINKVMKII